MLEPIFVTASDEGKRQKPSEVWSKFSTLRAPLPIRITCPLILTTSYVDNKGIEHEGKQTIQPINPSYNKEHIVDYGWYLEQTGRFCKEFESFTIEGFDKTNITEADWMNES